MQSENEFKDHFEYLRQTINVDVCENYKYNDHILTRFDQIGDLYEDPQQQSYINSVISGLYSYGIEKPSNVQSLAILPMLDGNDCIVQAQSGSGKTLTFLTIAMCKIRPSVKNMQILILTNSRELAHQIFLVAVTVFKNTGITFGLHIGGTRNNSYYNDKNFLEKDISNYRGDFNEQVVIGTPGRIKDLLDVNKNGKVYLDNSKLSLLILDEVDSLLSTGLLETTKCIIKDYVKESVQIGVFSATMPLQILTLTNHFMPKPIKILIPEKQVNLAGIAQFYINSGNEDKKKKELVNILPDCSDKIIMMYFNSIETLKEINDLLKNNKFNVLAIHSGLTQIERFNVMDDFKNRQANILLSTDLTSRGIDIHQISLVINYDIPKKPETYIHRIGRTGRFGRTGNAINFVTNDDKDILCDYMKRYNINMEEL